MKVRQLISVLQKLPPDAHVTYLSNDGLLEIADEACTSSVFGQQIIILTKAKSLKGQFPSTKEP